MRWETKLVAARLSGWLFIALLAAWLLAGNRANADENLVAISAINVTDILANVDGGLTTGAKVLDKIDLSASFTGDDHGHPGLTAFLNLQATDATDFSGVLTGDMQGISNIDAPAGFRVLNAWVAQDFDGLGGVKGGILDLNSEFDAQPTGALFLNPSHGIGPDFAQSGLNGPSIFPSTGLGLMGRWLPGDHWTLKAGVFEGIAGDPAHPGRTAVSLSPNEGILLAVDARKHLTPLFAVGGGTWYYTAAFDTIEAPRSVHGNGGVYVIADGTLYAEDPARGNAGLTGWLRLGFANDVINPIAFYLGGGLVYTGPWDREADQVGFAIARAQTGGPTRRAAALSGVSLGQAEMTLEVTYSYTLSETVVIQPDVQYIISPGADRAVRNALVIGSRITVSQNL